MEKDKDSDVRVCPTCDFEVGTKENGTKLKAHKVGGEKCDGSDSEVIDTVGLNAGDSFEAFEDAPESDENAPQGDDESEPEENSGDDSSEPEKGARSFTHNIRVHESCPYLNDKTWQLANGKLVEAEAKRAGHTLAGGEAHMVGVNPAVDGYIHLIYSVPVL